MSQNLEKIKRRINAIQSTLKITNAMKMISNVKMLKYKKELLSARAYLDIVKNIFSMTSVNESEKNNTNFFSENESTNNTLYILITTDLGLCGAYNLETYKFLNNLIKDEDELLLIGNKGYINYKNDEKRKLNTDFLGIYSSFKSEDLNSLSEYLKNSFLDKKFRAIHIVYHRYINSLKTEIVDESILPLKIDDKIKKENYEPFYYPNKGEIFANLTHFYLISSLNSVFIESLVSENSSRRYAMDNADKSARDMIDKLKLEYNKVRQQNITQEITEVVSNNSNR